MPYEINLPDMVIMYLQLIERLLTLMNGLDSNCREHQMLANHIGYYLDAINLEMTKLSKPIITGTEAGV